jgi:hypothetical protein
VGEPFEQLDGLEMGLQLMPMNRRSGTNPIFREAALCLGAVVLLAASGCQNPSNPEPSKNNGPSAEELEIQNRTRQIATETLGLKLQNDVTVGHKDNFLGVRTADITFSRRLDSRTFLAYDRRFSDTKEAGIYLAPDEALLKRSRELLARLKVPAAEIASEKVAHEKTRVGERDPKTGRFKLYAVEPGKKWARTTRQIEGVPVFSSRATIGLMPNGEVGFLDVHWPEIPAKVIEEARRYRKLAAKDWRAPELKGARVESITAGILHSPAAATAMDAMPAIRVVYAPLDRRIGKKPVTYVDPQGNPVAMPRVFLQPPREDMKTERVAPAR